MAVHKNRPVVPRLSLALKTLSKNHPLVTQQDIASSWTKGGGGMKLFMSSLQLVMRHIVCMENLPVVDY